MSETSETLQGWQPIETAPINQSVLVYIPNAEHYGEPIYRAIKVYFEGRQGEPYWTSTALHCSRDIANGYEPTRWMPLPQPPKEQDHENLFN